MLNTLPEDTVIGLSEENAGTTFKVKMPAPVVK